MPALDAFDAGHLLLFCNIVPLQIEGLIRDYALELGILARDLHGAALAKKLERIKAKSEIFLDFEYFRFRFPVLRNHVAHGHFESDNPEPVANLLLLDLLDLCRRLNQDDLPLNRIVNVVRTGSPDNPEDVYLYAQLRALGVPPFYADVPVLRAKFEVALSDAPLWDWLTSRVDEGDTEANARIRSVVIALKKDALDLGRAADLLRRIATKDGSVGR